MPAELFSALSADRAERQALRPLEGAQVAAAGSAHPTLTCVRHLTALGAALTPLALDDASDVDVLGVLKVSCSYRMERDDRVTCTIAPPPLASGATRVAVNATALEPLTQAMSGLMAAHGRDARRPRRLGIDVASEAAGVLAATGLLAAELARRRGRQTRLVETSMLHAAVTFLTHHIAMATCGDAWQPAVAGDAPGPPFVTADGAVLELEVPSSDAWVALWRDLGVDASLSIAAWPAFASRYNTAACSLPAAMHAAMSRRTASQVMGVAESRRVSICRQRSCSDVLRARDWETARDWEQPSDAVALPPPWLVRARMRGSRPAPRPTASGAPLDGIRVVESTHGLPGPLAGYLLQTLGADVVRVEPPGGDPARNVRPLAGSVGAGFLAFNRGKTPVEIDYKSATGQAAIAGLVADADVFLHNWLPGRAAALNLDPATLGARNPGLVHMWVSGWGGAIGAEDRVGIEYFVQAHCGVPDGLTPIGAPPAAARLILGGVMAGLLACEAIVAALCEREQTRCGRSLETSLFLGAMALQADIVRDLGARHEHGRRDGRPVWDALDAPLATGDGHLVVAAADRADRRRILEVCGVDAYASDPERRLLAALERRSAAQWQAALLDAGIPCAVVREDLALLPADPAVAPALEPAGDGCWAPGPPWRFAP